MKQGKKTKSKIKPYRSAFSNAIWSFREMMKEVASAFWLMVFEVPINVARTYAGVYLPALVVAEVTGNADLSHAVVAVGGVILFLFVTEALLLFLQNMSHVGLALVYRAKKSMKLERKSMNCFYQLYEQKEIHDLYDRAMNATQTWNGRQPISDMPRHSLKLVENILSYCLFGSMISLVSPWLVPLLTIAPLVNWLCARAYRKWEYANREKWVDLDRKLKYVRTKPSDYAAAKDIRIYGMAGWFRETYRELSKQRCAWDKRSAWRSFLSRIADLLVILIRDGAAYALLIQMTLSGEITVDKFVLYFAAISSFASFVGNIMKSWNDLHTASLKLCDYRQFMDISEMEGSGEVRVEDILTGAPEIRFEHVSFRYEGANQDTLHDISFTMKAGEKIALVGRNGAGKTTLVKLLCGLYQPTEGVIRINGISVDKFTRKDYYRLLSPVFQEIKTTFFSLAENVSGQIGDGTDYERAEQCMRLAGLGEKIDSLSQGIYSKLDKQVNKDGIVLSGGELQKLMLARAIYKDAPVLILDEPTAALDPIAENQIYLQYHDMTAKKTSLFISHRLASTQFCDRILYLKDGQIVEEGTHSELIALGGEYGELYEMQSCWYREDYVPEESWDVEGKESTVLQGDKVSSENGNRSGK